MAFLALGAVSSWGAAKPDFSGEWVLNMVRSEFGAQAPPKKLSQKIEHKDPALKVTQTEISPLDQAVKFESSYSTDGKEAANNVLGSTVKSTAKWEGDELVIHSWSEFAGRKVDIQDRLRLTENGDTVIVQRVATGVSGKLEQTLVLDRVVAGKK